VIRNGNHFEELLLETFLSATDAFSLFPPEFFQFPFAHDGTSGVEVRAQPFHSNGCFFDWQWWLAKRFREWLGAFFGKSPTLHTLRARD
jgi:hypothetical protein